MNPRTRAWTVALALLLPVACLSLPVRATPFTYPAVNGSTVSFAEIWEESVTDPSLALFGAPTITGDRLDFEASGFAASSSGGVPVQRMAALAMVVESLATEVIHNLEVRASGSYSLAGGPGFAQAAVGTALIGEIVEIDRVGVSPSLDLSFAVNLTFSGLNGSYTLGPSPESGVAWSGFKRIDLDELLASKGQSGHATRVLFSVANNTVIALSGAGTQASIEAQAFSVAANVPEPSFLLVAAGLAYACVLLRPRLRRHRAGPNPDV